MVRTDPFTITRPVEKPRFFSSLGMKMLCVASLLLVLSFSLCSAALLLLTRHMLQENLESMVARDSRFLRAVSQGLLPNITAAHKQRLSQFAHELLKDPEVLSIGILDSRR